MRPTWTAAEARAAFAHAPVAGLAQIAPHGALLVVAPHPDDESLGCGGLIAAVADAGRAVVVALMTDGAASHPGSRLWDAAGRAAVRRRELDGAVADLTGGAGTVHAFGAEDGELSHRTAAAQDWLTALTRESGAETLVSTWDADPHPDHKAAFAISEAVACASGLAHWAYPIWSLILPDDAEVGPRRTVVRLDIAATLDRKATAIHRHASQLEAAVLDDPSGFLLTVEDVGRHLQPFEPYLAISPG